MKDVIRLRLHSSRLTVIVCRFVVLMAVCCFITGLILEVVGGQVNSVVHSRLILFALEIKRHDVKALQVFRNV